MAQLIVLASQQCCLGFDSGSVPCCMSVKFVVGSCLAPRNSFLGFLVSSLHKEQHRQIPIQPANIRVMRLPLQILYLNFSNILF